MKNKTNNPYNEQVVEKPEPGETKPKVFKWIFSILILGALIAIFYFSCAPTSKFLDVYNITCTDSKTIALKNKDTTGKPSADVVLQGGDIDEWTYNSSSTINWSTTNATNYTFFIRATDKKIYSFIISYVLTDDAAGGRVHEWVVDGTSIDSSDATFASWLQVTSTTNAGLPDNSPTPLDYLINFLPTILIIGLLWWSVRKMGALQGGTSDGESGGGIFGAGKSLAKIAQSNIKFSDIAGIEEEKEELMEIVDYLKNPQKYVNMGARVPRGVILYGEPGTGKTLLAKAVSGEAKVPFFQISGSAFEDMFVGVGAKRIRDLFAKAKKASPSIIFIDEIDSVASKRGSNSMMGGGGIADQTINQLLAEMDGFNTKTGIVVIAATNRLDVLDEAILRPGRFDRHIKISLPDIKEREAILKIHSRNKNISTNVNFTDIARRTPGFSGAQLENVLNEATLLAVRFNKNTITMSEIDEAIDRVIAGPAKKSRVLNESEKKQIALHEAGHALVGLYSPGSEVVEKITIIPRGIAAGYTVSNPINAEIKIQKKSDLLNTVTSLLGGRAAEEIELGQSEVSTGASNDLYRATGIVRAMVTQLGMDEEVGMTQFVPSEGTKNPYQQKMYSEETAKKIDDAIENIIQKQYKLAKAIIVKNKKELGLLIEALLIVETIVKSDIDYIHKNKKLPLEVIKFKNKNKN